MMHAIVLPTGRALCGLSFEDNDLKGGYIFVETGMRLHKGRQYKLFRELVDCDKCLEVGKTLVDDVCGVCGTTLDSCCG